MQKNSKQQSLHTFFFPFFVLMGKKNINSNYIQLQQTLRISNSLLCRRGLYHLTHKTTPLLKGEEDCETDTASSWPWSGNSFSGVHPFPVYLLISGFPSARTVISAKTVNSGWFIVLVDFGNKSAKNIFRSKHNKTFPAISLIKCLTA